MMIPNALRKVLEAAVQKGLLLALSYARVSTGQQVDGQSLDVQEDSNVDFVTSMGLVVLPELRLREQGSGADDTRPELELVQAIVRSGLLRTVVIYDTDRLARDPLQVMLFLRLCKEYGVELWISGRRMKVEEAMGEMFEVMRGFFGELDRERIKNITMVNKERAARNGRMPCGIGRGMYAYKLNKDTGKMEIVEEEAAVLRDMFQWRVDGMSINGIARRLNELGITTKNGCRWESRSVRSKLKNIAYTGRRFYGMGRHKKGKIGDSVQRAVVPKPESEWILVPGFCERIISDALFFRVQKMWGEPQSPATNRKKWDYILTGVIFCAKCGTGMSGTTNMGRYPYYTCRGTIPSAKRDAYCDARKIRADWLEPVVISELKKVIRDPSGAIDDLRKHWSSGASDVGRQMGQLEKDVAGCAKKIQLALKQLMNEVISEAEFEEVVGPVRKREAALKAELEALEGQRELREQALKVETWIEECFAAYAEEVDNLDSDGIRVMLRRFGVRIVGSRESVVVSGTINPGLFTIEHTSA